MPPLRFYSSLTTAMGAGAPSKAQKLHTHSEPRLLQSAQRWALRTRKSLHVASAQAAPWPYSSAGSMLASSKSSVAGEVMKFSYTSTCQRNQSRTTTHKSCGNTDIMTSLHPAQPNNKQQEHNMGVLVGRKLNSKPQFHPRASHIRRILASTISSNHPIIQRRSG